MLPSRGGEAVAPPSSSPPPPPSPSRAPRARSLSRTSAVPIATTLPSTRQIVATLTTSPRVYVDALAMVTTTIRQSLVSGVIALAVNLVYAQGFFWRGVSPHDQSYELFVAATMANVALFMGLSMVLGFCATLVRYKWIHRPHAPMPALLWFVLLLFKSLPHVVLTLCVVVTIGYVCATLDAKWQPYQLQFYISGPVINLFTASLDVVTRHVFQTQTVEGVALGYVNRAPWWTKIKHAYRKDAGFAVAVYVAGGYVHIASRLQLRTQYDLLVFSFVSMGFRFLIMKTTRHFVLKLKKIHVRLLYVVAAVPTVMINTQVRVALLNVQANVSLTGVVILAAVEPVMRVLKVWNARRDILLRSRAPTSSIGQALMLSLSSRLWSAHHHDRRHAGPPRWRVGVNAVVPSSLSSTRVASPVLQVHSRVSKRTDRGRGGDDAAQLAANAARRDQWVKRVLQFTAAEIHADMCSEYIAIACSMSIYFCLHGHPKFAWREEQSEDWSSSAATSRLTRVQVVVIQLVVEILVDFVCCLWELANGIPLRATSGMDTFLVVVFTGCAVTNITVCCSIYLRKPMESVGG